MPTRAKTQCRSIRCRARIPQGQGGYCQGCQRGQYRRDRNQRGTSTERGYDARHRQWRKLVLAKDPLCVHCEEKGVIRLSVIADHIDPLDPNDPQAGDWSLENGRGLCVACHNIRHAEDR